MGERAGDLDERKGKKGWNQNSSGTRFVEMQGQIRDGAKTRRDLRSGPIANKGEEARVVETKQNTDAVVGRGTGQQSGAPNLAQQQQWLGALIALTQGNPMLGPMGNNVVSSSLS